METSVGEWGGLLASFWVYTEQQVLDSAKLKRQQLCGSQCMRKDANTPKSSSAG